LIISPPLEAPRLERNQRHALLDILLRTVCAAVSGADGWEAVEDFGGEKLDWLRRLLQKVCGWLHESRRQLS
jgi:hypothetical protein